MPINVDLQLLAEEEISADFSRTFGSFSLDVEEILRFDFERTFSNILPQSAKYFKSVFQNQIIFVPGYD